MATTATAPVSVAGTIATSVANSATSQLASQSTANDALSGVVANLGFASDDSLERIADQIIRTPNAGMAMAIAEKILVDLKIADPMQRAMALMQDRQALSNTVAAQAQHTGILSGIFAAIGL